MKKWKPIIIVGLVVLSITLAWGQTFTLTTNLNFKKPTVGSANWGATVNDNFDSLDSMLSGTTPTFGLVPNVTGSDLGSTTARWDVFANDLDIYSDTAFALSITHSNTAARNWIVPDFPSTFVGTTGTQALTGKTLTSPIMGTQMTLEQTTANYTLSWDDPGGARAISITDPGGTDSLAWLAASQTFTNKTLTNPIVPVANPLEGALSNQPRWIFKQVDHTDMTAVATADTFTLWTLPANTMIHDVVGSVGTAWTGGGPVTVAVCSVGTAAGSANDLALDDDFFTTGTRFELHDATASGGKGTLLFDATDKFAPHMFVAGGVIEIQCDLTGGNHSATSTGQAFIYILVSQPLGNITTEAN